MPTLAVIIPTLNEEAWIAASVRSAFAGGADEVIVADGGSTDATTRIASEHGARVVESDPPRSRQLNRAATTTGADNLLFLHADTLLPVGAAMATHDALRHGEFGGYRLAFVERSF